MQIPAMSLRGSERSRHNKMTGRQESKDLLAAILIDRRKRRLHHRRSTGNPTQNDQKLWHLRKQRRLRIEAEESGDRVSFPALIQGQGSRRNTLTRFSTRSSPPRLMGWASDSLFAGVLIVWITINSIAMMGKPFDPYPFILLNLVLSCLAAIQAPVIMMSQNRQESKDRLRAENDYRVNLKAELEIRHLHSKIDLLLTHQWQRLLEIQQVQTDLLEELGNNR